MNILQLSTGSLLFCGTGSARCRCKPPKLLVHTASLVSESCLLCFLTWLSMSRCCLPQLASRSPQPPCAIPPTASILELHTVVILGLGTSSHEWRVLLLIPSSPSSSSMCAGSGRAPRGFFRKKYLSGFSYICHWPAELSFSFEGEGFPTLCCELSLLTSVIWCGQDGLGGDSSVLDSEYC